jgi:hypothetical protein
MLKPDLVRAASANATNREFHLIIRRLLDKFGDREDVLKRIEQDMHGFGWTAAFSSEIASARPGENEKP